MVGPADVDAHMPGEALPVTTAAPTPTENTVGIELTSATERATVAEVLSTEPRAEGERGRGRGTLPRRDMREDEGALKMPP